MTTAPREAKESEHYVDVSGVKDSYIRDLCLVRFGYTQREWEARLMEMAWQRWHSHRAVRFREAAAILREEG